MFIKELLVDLAQLATSRGLVEVNNKTGRVLITAFRDDERLVDVVFTIDLKADATGSEADHQRFIPVVHSWTFVLQHPAVFAPVAGVGWDEDNGYGDGKCFPEPYLA